MLLLTLAQILCLYVALSLVVEKTVHMSESNGFHDERDFKRLLGRMVVLSEENIKVEEVGPPWGTPASKLGESMRLTVSYRIVVPCFSSQINVVLHYKCEGVNTGLYGSGY